MAILDILLAPDPRLNTVCASVDAIDDSLGKLVDDMFDTMYEAPGIGLAAPQIGVLKRFFVVDVGDDEDRDPRCFINPEITARSDETSVQEEGCLSLPKLYGDVERAVRITVRFQDRNGATSTLDADGMLARCIQHEMDHLDGILFVDHLSALKRKMLLRRAAKAKRNR